MIARDEIVDVLEASPALPSAEYAIEPYARNITPPQLPTIMVRVDELRPSRAVGAMWDVTAALIVIEPQTTPGPADESLDAALADVLFALDTEELAEKLRWTVAKRITFKASEEPEAPSFPAYEITIETLTVKE